MALRFLVGPAGSGKTRTAFDHLIEASLRDTGRSLSFVIVPEQYSLQTQMDMMELHPRHGSMAIDVISFERLAWLIIEEAGQKAPLLLDDLGQILLLRSVLAQEEDRLGSLRRNIRKPGFIEELKDLISEFSEYRVDTERFRDLKDACARKPLLSEKLSDLSVILKAFRERLEEGTIPKEDILHYFCRFIPESKILRNSEIVLDGFTGFTPDQCEVIRELLRVSRNVTVLLTLGTGPALEEIRSDCDLFWPTVQTWRQLTGLAEQAGVPVDEPKYLGGPNLPRFRNAPDLRRLEAGFGRPWAAVNEPPYLCTADVSVVRAEDPRREAEYIALQIARLVREEGFRYRDIAVICSDIHVYARQLERAFEMLEIPYFLDAARTLDMNPFASLVLSLTEPVEKGFSHESVFRLLKSGFVPLVKEECDLLENYALAHGVRGVTAWKNTWTGEDPEIEQINDIRVRAVSDLVTLSETLGKKGKTVTEKLDAIRFYLDTIGLEEQLKGRAAALEASGELNLSMEYGRLWELTRELFDRIASVLGSETLSAQELREVLTEGFRRMRAGVIPQSMDSVLAGDLSRSRLGNIRVLFFAGFNEGLLPGSGGEGGILSDLEREFMKAAGIELRPTPKENAILQKLRTYQNLTRPTDRVSLSYSTADEKGKRLYPSSYLSDVLQVFGEDLIRDAADLLPDDGIPYTRRAARMAMAEGMRRLTDPVSPEANLYAWFLTQEEERGFLETVRRAATLRYQGTRIDPSSSAELVRGALNGSATRLETYASCAYRWFLAYILQLRERKIRELDQRDIGTMLHAVIEEYFRRMLAEGFGFSQNEAERHATVRDCVKYVLETDGSLAQLSEDERGIFRAERLADLCDRAVWALLEQGKRGDFVPEAQELAFSAEDTKAMRIELNDETVMRLRGRIDRVDVFDDGSDCLVKIIDYKSGAKDLDLTYIYHGIQIQLLLYLNAAAEIEAVARNGRRILPAGAFYFHIGDMWADMTQELKRGDVNPEEALLACYRMKGFANGDPEILPRIDHALDSDHDGKSVVIQAAVKDGMPDARSKTLSTESFERLMGHTRERIRAMGQSMLAGEVSLNPYRFGQGDACSWCPYQDVCAFERSLPGFRARPLQKITPEDLGL